MKILLIDKSEQSPTAKIVAKVVDDHAGAKSPATQLQWRFMHTADCGEQTGTASDADVIFVSSGEPAPSARTIHGSSQGCQSLAIAQALARDRKVYLVRHSDASPLSGVEVLAAAASGLSGVLDDRDLLLDVVLPTVGAHIARDRRYASLLALGRYGIAIERLRTMLEKWDEDADWDPTLDMACWRTGMALGQLNELLPIRGLGDRYSFVKLAQALNMQRSRTGFHLSEGDLRRTLSRLAFLWMKDSYHPAERVRLPDYARANGFPEHIPVIAGVIETDVPRRLYEMAKVMELIDATGLTNRTHRVVRLPLRLVTNQRTRPTRKAPQ